MFEIGVTQHFDAAHRLDGYPGVCSRTHGHRFSVEVTLSGNKLDRLGMLIDFKTVKDRLNDVLCQFDHYYINEEPNFRNTNPTAENLANFIYGELLFRGLKVDKVTIWETPECRVSYSEP